MMKSLGQGATVWFSRLANHWHKGLVPVNKLHKYAVSQNSCDRGNFQDLGSFACSQTRCAVSQLVLFVTSGSAILQACDPAKAQPFIQSPKPHQP